MVNGNLESRTANFGYGGLTPVQITAIKKGVLLGRELQTLYPEIAEDYRKGMSHQEIANQYNIAEQFRVDQEIAKSAVRYSIRGAVRGFGLEQYPGLITNEKELEELAQSHHRENGIRTYEKGVGIHGMSKEELRAAGIRTYEKGVGIHGMSREERIEAGRKSAILRGNVPYTDSEKKRILELHQEIGKGVRGKNKKIAKIVNLEVHGGKRVRSFQSINVIIGRLAN